MSLLNPMSASPGFVKAGFLGFSGSGKTFTATELAIGTRSHFKMAGPVAMFDTEGGSDYLRKKVRAATGVDMVGVKSRSFGDLMEMGKECLSAGVSVLIVDSVTHVWRELCEAYLAQVNANFKSRGWNRKQEKLEFPDWAAVKSRWNNWTDFYLNAPLHIIICGRAGFEYDFEVNDKGKKELIKTGIKMKAEGEFGFEPSLLVEMERDMDLETRVIVRKATVLKDRFDLIDGKTAQNPTFAFFEPHVAQLVPDGHTEIDVAAKTHFDIEDGEEKFRADKRKRTILAEEIQGELVKHYPGQGAEDKKTKVMLLERHFGTKAWTAIEEKLPVARLELGLRSLREELAPPVAPPKGEPDALPDWPNDPVAA